MLPLSLAALVLAISTGYNIIAGAVNLKISRAYSAGSLNCCPALWRTLREITSKKLLVMGIANPIYFNVKVPSSRWKAESPHTLVSFRGRVFFFPGVRDSKVTLQSPWIGSVGHGVVTKAVLSFQMKTTSCESISWKEAQRRVEIGGLVLARGLDKVKKGNRFWRA